VVGNLGYVYVVSLWIASQGAVLYPASSLWLLAMTVANKEGVRGYLIVPKFLCFFIDEYNRPNNKACAFLL